MKSVPLLSLILLVVFTGCDPYNFGYKKNPAFVLNETFHAIFTLDEDRFITNSGIEALCVYGNKEGIAYLRDHLTLDPRSINFSTSVHSAKYTDAPKWVDFWSYYSERYVIEIIEKLSEKTYVDTVIDCHFGVAGSKDDRYINVPKEKYPRKECRLVKIIPQTFAPLPMPLRCADLFQVKL